jgi:uncharacterized damage-inducible protein DinB
MTGSLPGVAAHALKGPAMDTEDTRTLYTYNRWANHRVVPAARLLAARDFTRDLGASHGSVRGTLVHILWGEWLWLQRWRSDSPKQVFAPEQFPDVAALEAQWAIVERDQQIFIEGLTDERLNARVAYENLQGERWEYSLRHMMQHVVNHSSYHRGQVVTLLRQLGHTPPATDFLVFFDEAA